MIISHKHKFIFIKTVKTAGTSVEIALSKFCGEDDVITPIGANDEAVRSQLGYRGPQNYSLSFGNYSAADWYKLFFRRIPLAFWNHADAGFINKYVDEEVWRSYFKFCFERNPWDKAVSYYFFQLREMNNTPSISDFIQSGMADNIRGYRLYSIGDEIAVDKVFLFERLQEAVDQIERQLRLPGKLELPVTKNNFRKDKRHYRDILSEQDREKIANQYTREIAQFGYEW